MKGPNCTVTCPSTLLHVYSCFNCLPLSHIQWFSMHVKLLALANFWSVQTCLPVVFNASYFSSKWFQLIWPDPIPMKVFSVFTAAVFRNTSLWDAPKCLQPAQPVFEGWGSLADVSNLSGAEQSSPCFQEVDFFTATRIFVLTCCFAE